jgi:hypothetical protein
MLIDQGVDVVTCHVDGPKVTADRRRPRRLCLRLSCQPEPARPGALSTDRRRMELGGSLQRGFVTKMMAGEPLPNFVRGGVAEGFVKMSPYRADGQRRGKSQCRRRPRRDQEGRLPVIKGPLNDNAGNEIVPAGTAYVETAIELESMNYPSRARPPENPQADGSAVAQMMDQTALGDLRARPSVEVAAPLGEWLAAVGGVRHPVLAVVVGLALFGVFVLALGKSRSPSTGHVRRLRTWFSVQNPAARLATASAALCGAPGARLGLVIIGGEGAIVLGGLARRPPPRRR